MAGIHDVEEPHFSKYNRLFPSSGHICCKACGNPLYSWKFEVNFFNGWPTFGSCVKRSLELGYMEEWSPFAIEIHCFRDARDVLETFWRRRMKDLML
jgi:peptide methionine sulfoxide reductase MsrB